MSEPERRSSVACWRRPFLGTAKRRRSERWLTKSMLGRLQGNLVLESKPKSQAFAGVEIQNVDDVLIIIARNACQAC